MPVKNAIGQNIFPIFLPSSLSPFQLRLYTITEDIFQKKKKNLIIVICLPQLLNGSDHRTLIALAQRHSKVVQRNFLFLVIFFFPLDDILYSLTVEDHLRPQSHGPNGRVSESNQANLFSNCLFSSNLPSPYFPMRKQKPADGNFSNDLSLKRQIFLKNVFSCKYQKT